MKRTRLDRGSWWSHNHITHTQYYQMRVDTAQFHGLLCLVRLFDGEPFYWDLPIAGKTQIIGAGMQWLQLLPDNARHAITAKYLPKAKTVCGKEYENSVSLWYVDMIENVEYDADGVAVFVDQYLDVIFTPAGDVIVDDRDELDAAYASGELSESQYNAALAECDTVLATLCKDIEATEQFCSELLVYAKECIKNGLQPFQYKKS
ncbi:MAG: DUF402 domain-containing protein [Clostridia bacterium]|nr:DUF402 domain-containing protein [Clostridia bacterium]